MKYCIYPLDFQLPTALQWSLETDFCVASSLRITIPYKIKHPVKNIMMYWTNFYFVSEAQKFKDLFSFFFLVFFLRGHFSNLNIFNMLSTHFFTEWMVYFSCIIRWIFFPVIYPVSRFLTIFKHDSLLQNMLKNVCLLCTWKSLDLCFNLC